MASSQLFISYPLFLVLQAFLSQVHATPLPQSPDPGSSTPTTTLPGDGPTYPTDYASGGSSVDTESIFEKYWYYIFIAIALVILLIGGWYAHRRRQALARQQATNGHASLQQSLSALSTTFHHQNAVRHQRASQRYGGQRMSGNMVAPPGWRRDVDGLRLDHNESGEAPPPYVKEDAIATCKPVHTRSMSGSSDDRTLCGPSNPVSRDGHEDVELNELPANMNTPSSRLPGYGELDGTPATTQAGYSNGRTRAV